jgi:hypothetical protein
MAKKTDKKIDLPPDVLVSDTKYPDWKSDDRVVNSLTLHKVNGFGWCIATLHIRNQSSRSMQRHGAMQARTYAVRVDDGAAVRVGLGPHVTSTVTVYVRASRAAALKKYTDLYDSGMAKAGEIRDQTSSRRAQGSLRRAASFNHWLR